MVMTDEPAAATRYFVVDSFDGPTPEGKYTIIAKDVLKFADGDRSQAPDLSNGFLAADITASAHQGRLARDLKGHRGGHLVVDRCVRLEGRQDAGEREVGAVREQDLAVLAGKRPVEIELCHHCRRGCAAGNEIQLERDLAAVLEASDEFAPSAGAFLVGRVDRVARHGGRRDIGHLGQRGVHFRYGAVARLEQRAVTDARLSGHRDISMSEFEGSPRHAPAGLGKRITVRPRSLRQSWRPSSPAAGAPSRFRFRGSS